MKTGDMLHDHLDDIMTNKCAHPACSCTVPEGKMYCSDKCATGNPSNAKCECGHPGCKGP